MSTQNIPVPFQDRIVISKNKPETTTAGGIIIPSGAIKEDNKGIVVAVGPLVGKTSASRATADNVIPMVGDLVLFGEYAGMEITHEDTKYLIVKEADVLARL